jgi:hypothetical protein
VVTRTSPPDSPPADIRSARPYLLSTAPLKGSVRRLASMAALAAIDLFGLAAGIFLALALRDRAGSIPSAAAGAASGAWPPRSRS